MREIKIKYTVNITDDKDFNEKVELEVSFDSIEENIHGDIYDLLNDAIDQVLECYCSINEANPSCDCGGHFRGVSGDILTVDEIFDRRIEFVL